MAELTEITSGLRFPEGPIAMPDGSVILVEMFGKCITRVKPDGTKEKIADVPGGPNGIAFGPDCGLYICNNGGSFSEVDFLGLTFPGPFVESNYIGGRIQRLDMETGELKDLYTECNGHKLRGPNDIVFDTHGGMWFTDHGIRMERTADLTGIYYAKIDGSMIKEVVFPLESPNGIGLSPDGNTLYWAETFTGRVFKLAITAPGEAAQFSPIDPSNLLCGLPGLQLFDSLAVDGDGNVCVATLGLQTAGVTVISPTGEVLEQILTGDPLTTNICFGGPDFKTAYLTLSGTGRLVSMPWPHKGLKLNY
jgi:gluconolactonase